VGIIICAFSSLHELARVGGKRRKELQCGRIESESKQTLLDYGKQVSEGKRSRRTEIWGGLERKRDRASERETRSATGRRIHCCFAWMLPCSANQRSVSESNELMAALPSSSSFWQQRHLSRRRQHCRLQLCSIQ